MEPLKEIPITTNWNGNVELDQSDLNCPRSESKNFICVFVLGYYQEDVVTNAVNYTSFNRGQGVLVVVQWSTFGCLAINTKEFCTFIQFMSCRDHLVKGCLICKSDVYQWSIGIEFWNWTVR
jgi:hypothetical protein